MKQCLCNLQKTIALISVGILISSCGRDIPSLQKVEDAVEKLSITANDISQDMYGSCVRATQFFGTPASPNLFTQRQSEEKYCDDNYLKISSITGDANEVLINYMNSLVLIAKGEQKKGTPISFDESYNNLENSLINLKISSSSTEASQPLFKEAEVKAGVSIAKFLTNLFTKEIRRDNLKQAILCTNNDIQTYIRGEGAVEGQPEPGGLIGIANKVYVNGLLVSEETSIRIYFSQYIALLGNDLRKNPLDFIDLEEKYNSAMDSVRKHRQKAETYTEILRNLASLHASLKTEFAKDGDTPLDGEKFDKYCQDLFKPPDSKTLDKIQKQEIKPETMRRVQAIIAKEMIVIEPLLEELD